MEESKENIEEIKPKKKTSWLILVFLLIAIVVLIFAYLLPRTKPHNKPIINEGGNVENPPVVDVQDEDVQDDDYDDDDYEEDDEDDWTDSYTNDNGETIGKSYKDEDGDYVYYSETLDKVLYGKGETKYDSYYLINDDYLGGTIKECKLDEEDDEVCYQTYLDILDLKESKLLKRIKTNNSELEIYACIEDEFLLTYPEGPSEGCIEAYTKDLKFIAKCPQSINYQTVDKDRLYLANNGVIKTYNKNGKLINTSKKYNNLVKIIGNYKVILDDKLRLITPDEKEIVFTKWNKKKMEFHSLISGWYKGGIYLVIEDKNVTTNEAWTYCKNHLDDCGIESKKDLNDISKGYEYYYIPKTGKKGKIATTIGGYAKPVLYLYPEEKTNVTVTFDKPDNLTTTYPKYKNNWSITAYPNGDLYDSDNKYYYALYWEELKNHEVTFDEGFYVNKDNAIEFLESKLTTLGLSPRERNEFIMYWLPILENNEHNLIYFEQTEERDNYSKITITPKPDSILRIAMHVKKVNGRVNIKEQKLNTFKRNGFVAVEWGGVIH